MIETVLKEVRDAENKAEQMQKDAYQRGKELVLNAEVEAETQRKSTVRECKEERTAALDEARRNAERKSQAYIKKGADSAAAMEIDRRAEVEACANKVAAMFIAKYVEQPAEENVTEDATEEAEVANVAEVTDKSEYADDNDLTFEDEFNDSTVSAEFENENE